MTEESRETTRRKMVGGAATVSALGLFAVGIMLPNANIIGIAANILGGLLGLPVMMGLYHGVMRLKNPLESIGWILREPKEFLGALGAGLKLRSGRSLLQPREIREKLDPIEIKADSVILSATKIADFLERVGRGEVPSQGKARSIARRLAIEIESASSALLGAVSGSEGKLSVEVQRKVDLAQTLTDRILGEAEFSRLAMGQEPVTKHLQKPPASEKVRRLFNRFRNGRGV